MINTINHFAAADPQAYAKRTAGVPAMSFRENLQSTFAERDKAAARQNSGKLSAEELAELSGKYNPSHMTQEQYHAFLDELEEKGVLSKTEKMLVKCPEMRFCELGPGKATIITGEPLEPLTSRDYNSNASLFVKNVLERELALAERTPPLKEDLRRIAALRKVSNILDSMGM